MKFVHYHFDRIDSTNTWAKIHAEKFDRLALTIVTAEEQTAGRGRFKRQWISPRGANLYMTFCFFLDVKRLDIGFIPQLLALSTAEVLEQWKFKPTLKWPNDVLLGHKKVAGILCETVMVDHLRCVICGIGLNVNMPSSDLEQIDRPATSLYVESTEFYSVDKVSQALQQQFYKNLNHFINHGFANFFEKFQMRSYLIPGQFVRFHDNQQWVEGYFNALNIDGSITLQLLDGNLKVYYAGEFNCN